MSLDHRRSRSSLYHPNVVQNRYSVPGKPCSNTIPATEPILFFERGVMTGFS